MLRKKKKERKKLESCRGEKIRKEKEGENKRSLGEESPTASHRCVSPVWTTVLLLWFGDDPTGAGGSDLGEKGRTSQNRKKTSFKYKN